MLKDTVIPLNNPVKFRTACPQCRAAGGDRKGDNLIVRQDESGHCHACGYHEAGPNEVKNKVAAIRATNEVMGRIKSTAGLQLPEDFSLEIPLEPLRWLVKYGVSNDMRQKHNIGWSQSRSAVVLPLYDDKGRLLMFQMRFFNRPDQPKYRTVGALNGHIPIMYRDGPKHPTDTLVAVEDILSAIVVSEVCDAVPMLSSQLRPKDVAGLARMYFRLVLWGDPDQMGNNGRRRASYSQLFQYGCGMVVSSKDPKEYRKDEISDFLYQQADVSEQLFDLAE